MKKFYFPFIFLCFFVFTLIQKSTAQTYALLPFSEKFEKTWVDQNGTRDVSSLNWKNTPAATDSSWSRDDDGYARLAWSSTTKGEYTPTGANLTAHSARFHSSLVPKKNTGKLDLYVDFSTPTDSKYLSFWYINTSGQDSLKVFLSTDGGTTFGDAVIELTVRNYWTKYEVDLGNSVSPTCVLRFLAIGDDADGSDIGIDEINISTTSIPMVINFTANRTTGIAPVTVQFIDTSSMDALSWDWYLNGDDIIDATTQNPRYTYTTAGKYKVKLVGKKIGYVSGPNEKENYIDITASQYATLPFDETFDATWINRDSIRDVPSVYFKNQYSNGNNSWRRDDDAITGAWGSTHGNYLPSGALKSPHSARFHSFGTNLTGYMDIYIDFSSQTGSKTLTFWYLNQTLSGNPLENRDSLKVFLSTDGGATFGNALNVQKVSSEWALVTVDLGDVTTSTGVIRFTAYGDTGSSDLAFDQIHIENPANSAVGAEFNTNISAGIAPLTVNFTDLSTGMPTAWAWDFDNDGTVDATTQSPSYTFNTTGLFNVELKVSKTGSSDSIVKTGCIYVGGYASLPLKENFENVWLDRNYFRDVPSIYVKCNPANAVNAWSRDDDGEARKIWTDLTGAYSLSGANSSAHSARFHSSVATGIGDLDYYVNFSTLTGDKTLSFWYINPDGVDSLKVYLSTNGGTNFGNALTAQKIAGDWTKVSIDLGNVTATNGIIRFRAYGDGTANSKDLGLDEITIWTTGVSEVVADFTSNEILGSTSSVFNFTDQSAGSPTTWAWDFNNDGTIDATTQNPSHTYASAGKYTVKLVVSKAGVTDDFESKTEYITVVTPIDAQFTASNMSGVAPLEVSFTDQSTGTPTTWAWDFNSDATVDATTQNPTFTFTTAGEYNVKLVASKPGSSSTKTVSISVIEPVVAQFAANKMSGAAPLEVSFTDQSTGTPTTWAWDFNSDATVDATTQNPTFTFAIAGEYNVKLVASKPGSSSTKTVSISVIEPVVAQFIANKTSGVAPLEVSFTDQSTGMPTTWAWDFNNDGTVDATIQNPTFTFATAGSYTVKLLASKPGSDDPEVKMAYIVVEEPVVAQFTANVTSGNAPLQVIFTDQSTGTPTTWAWDFNNDGTVDATTQNATYTYPTAGTYNVKLEVTKTGSADPEVKTNYITVNPATGIALTDDESNTVEVYPNPAYERVSVKLNKGLKNEIVTIIVLNSNGKILRTIESQNQDFHDLDLSKYTPGIYFIKTISKDKTYMKKLVIQ